MLSLQNVSKQFNGQPVIRDVSLRVPEGTTHALIGASGSGKTTLLRITLGLIPFDRGYVRIQDQPLMSFTRREWAERVGYVPQDGGLFPHLTGGENVALIGELRRWSRSRIRERTQELLSVVELQEDVLARYPHELSGGQKQRVSLMRAALLNPSVLLLDEPLAALDPLVRSSLQEELKSIFGRLKKTVLFVTHDLGEAVYLSDRITLLNAGQVVQTGTYRELLYSPADPFVTRFINSQRSLPDLEPPHV